MALSPFNIVKVIGAVIAMITVLGLLYSLIASWFKQKLAKTMITHAVIVCIFYIVYQIDTIVNRTSPAVKTACEVKMTLIAVLYLCARGAMQYFFVARMHITLEGTGSEFGRIFIRVLQFAIVAGYLLFCILHIMIARYYEYNPEDDLCWPIEEQSNKFLTTVMIQFLFTMTLGIVTVGLVSNRLHALYKLRKSLGAMDAETNTRLLNLIRRQSKLAYITFVPTPLVHMIGPGLGSLPGLGSIGLIITPLDTIIPILCLYCTFNFSHSRAIYRYVCDCNGNKYLQWMCCCCGCICTCCCEPCRCTCNVSAEEYKQRDKEREAELTASAKTGSTNDTTTGQTNQTENTATSNKESVAV